MDIREQMAEFYIHTGMVHFALRDFPTAISAWDKVALFNEDLGQLAQSYIEAARREIGEQKRPLRAA